MPSSPRKRAKPRMTHLQVVRATTPPAELSVKTSFTPARGADHAAATEPRFIVNLSELPPEWNWVASAFRDKQTWCHVSAQNFAVPHWVPRRDSVARLGAGWHAVSLLGKRPSVLVSHGPRPAMYAALIARARRRPLRHLAYSFNYTDLPGGVQRKVMASAFRSVDRFVVFSSAERALYAEYFHLPIDRFDMLHWGVQPPECSGRALVQGDYVCALGSQARDYVTLAKAMKRLPGMRLVLVAAPENLVGVDVPDNVTVYSGIPLSRALNILAHSRYMVLPLRDSRVPCGHVTIVAAMHLGKAVITTDSAGLADYVTPGRTALVCPQRDERAWALSMQMLYEDPKLAERLGVAGKCFAREHCTEERVVQYFKTYLAAAPANE